MTRILFWVALICLVVAAIRVKLKSASSAQPRQPAQPQRKAGPEVADGKTETMLCCAHCGVYYPASETVQVEGRDFCSPAHARLPAP